MAPNVHDPYKVLEVSPAATDAQLHAAYRRMVQLHHPDHNGGSPESARRFEEIQEAYARVVELRKARPRPGGAAPGHDPGVDARLAEMERHLREAAEQARERARRAAREATAQRQRRATDEELGYIKTDDSLSKILADARSELSDRFAEAGEHPVAKRVSELIDELAHKLTGDR